MYLAIALALSVAAHPLTFKLGKWQGIELGKVETVAKLNDQYIKYQADFKKRELAAVHEQYRRQLSRGKRSDKLLKELQDGKNCSSRPYDPCLRKFMELRDRAETNGEL